MSFFLVILCLYFRSFIGCAGSSCLCRLFSSCSALTCHYDGFSSCRARALGHLGFSGFGSQALEHRLMWDPPGSGIEPLLLHWQADPLPLGHQGSPPLSLSDGFLVLVLGPRCSGMCVRLALIIGARGSKRVGNRDPVLQTGEMDHQECCWQGCRKAVYRQFGIFWTRASRPWPALSTEVFLDLGLNKGGVLSLCGAVTGCSRSRHPAGNSALCHAADGHSRAVPPCHADRSSGRAGSQP